MTLNELLTRVPEDFRDAPLVTNMGRSLSVTHLIADDSGHRVVVLATDCGVLPPDVK